MTDAGFIVRNHTGRPIGAVIAGRGLAANRFAGWTRRGKVGEFASPAEAIDAVRRAASTDRKEEKRK